MPAVFLVETVCLSYFSKAEQNKDALLTQQTKMESLKLPPTYGEVACDSRSVFTAQDKSDAMGTEGQDCLPGRPLSKCPRASTWAGVLLFPKTSLVLVPKACKKYQQHSLLSNTFTLGTCDLEVPLQSVEIMPGLQYH